LVKKRLLKKVLILTLAIFYCFSFIGCGPKVSGLPEEKTPIGFELIGEVNSTLMQAFYWEMNTGTYQRLYPGEANLWSLLQNRAREPSALDITALWLPPAAKGGMGDALTRVGYDVYDLWDLGEFDQKGSIRTKYGTRRDLDRVIRSLHANGIKVYFDAVLNHRMGADAVEEVKTDKGSIKAWTKFDYPGRKGRYYN